MKKSYVDLVDALVGLISPPVVTQLHYKSSEYMLAFVE